MLNVYIFMLSPIYLLYARREIIISDATFEGSQPSPTDGRQTTTSHSGKTIPPRTRRWKTIKADLAYDKNLISFFRFKDIRIPERGPFRRPAISFQ